MALFSLRLHAQSSVRLVDCGVIGVLEAQVDDPSTDAIEWDRFSRLSAAARQILALQLPAGEVILDVGGYDGALALFLPRHRVWVVDPATTGAPGDVVPVGDRQFNVVVSVDALEHVERPQRAAFLRELVRVCRSTLLINTPAARSMDAQRTAYALTGHRFIGEHVNLVLPSADETAAQLRQIDSNVAISTVEFTSIAAWMPWFVLLQKDRPSAMVVSAVLKENTALSNQSPYLYDLLVCTLGVSVLSTA